MFTHVAVGTNDLQKSKQFYDALFGAMGANPGMETSMETSTRVVYSHNGAGFMVTEPLNGEPAQHANGGTIGFAMSSPEQIDAWHAAGIASGGVSCEAAPGVRDTDIGKLYLAYLRDPDGNKLCAVFPLDQ